MLNQLLGGHYRVVQNLQEGGLAKTYIAEDHHRPGHPKCAVKFLKPASKESDFLPTARRLFNQEAEILEKLGQHDQIPRLLAYFEENQEFYLVQEFIEGHPLSQELPQGHRWRERKVVQMLQDILLTLEFVHSYGVIHRDIKPNNLIRRQRDGRLVLIDFGAVKQVSTPRMNTPYPVSQKTIAIGTQGYMPTEQIRGKPRLNSDIYALGMIGIQALTGVYPIYLQEDEEGEVIWQDLANVSDELAAIITSMVRYHFKDRYQSVTDVIRELQPLVNRYDLILPNLGTPSSEIDPESELRRQQLSLIIDSAISGFSEIVTEVVLPETNPEPASQPPIFKTESESERRQQHSSLSTDPGAPRNPKAVTEGELQETKPEPASEPPILHLQRDSELELQKTKVVLEFEQVNSTIVPDKEKQGNLVFPLVSFAPLKDLWSSYTAIFQSPNKSRLMIGGGITFMIIGLFTGYTYINDKQSYLQAEVTLEQIKALKATEKYQECLKQAQTFTQEYSYFQAEASTLLHQCSQAEAKGKLAQARKQAEQSRFKDAIAIVSQIPEDTDVYSEAQQLRSQWSEQMFQIASNRYQEGNLQEATAIALSVPADSPWGQKVEATIQQWNEEWQQNQNHLQTAQKGLEERRWQDAINAAEKVSNTTYWQQQSAPIIQKARAEIATAKATASRTTSQPRSRTTSSRSRIFPRSLSNSLRSKSVPRSRTTSPRSKSTDWICLNNPNPKCR